MKTYQLIFCQGSYRSIDFEGSLEECEEVKYELQSQMYMFGERNFTYIIKEKQ